MSISEPAKIVIPWASTGSKNPIPENANNTTGAAGFDKGFPDITMTPEEAGGLPPAGQDFNGIFYQITEIIRYIQAGGQPTFSDEMSASIGGYPIGSIVVSSNRKTFWINNQDGNTNNPEVSPSGWSVISSGTLIMSKLEAMAKSDWIEGQKCIITDFGFEFKFTSSRALIPPYADTEITYEDALHILISSGGMLQFCDWSLIRKQSVENDATFAGLIKSNSLPIQIDIYGDSIAFGQVMPNTAGAVNRTGDPTGFGDGSVYSHWQYTSNYPVWIASFLQENLPNTVTVSNRGFSGDTALMGYLRHRVTTGAKCAIIGYGINDVNVATSNGSAPQNILSAQYSISGYTSMLRLFAAKQILLGKRVVILGTSFYAGLSGYDGTQFSSPRIARAYNEAAKAVADEFGCMYIDVCQDIFNQYSIPAITQEATHLNETGLRIMGVRIASAVASVATINRVSHGSVLAANPQINTVLTKLSGNILPNSTSVTARGAITDEPTTMLAGDSWITIPFYAESDGLVAYINGIAPVGGVDTEIRIDDGATQADYLHQYSFFGGKPASAKAFAVAGKFGRETENISDVASMLLVVANRGWHSISIKRRSGLETLLFDSIYFEYLPSVIASDMLGVTAKASRFQSGFDSAHSVNVRSISSPSVGRVDVVFNNHMSHDRYTAVVDFVSPNIANTYKVVKSTTGLSVYFLSGAGAGLDINFQPFTPETMTISVLGGR